MGQKNIGKTTPTNAPNDEVESGAWLVLVLDITGSMGGQIEGVKQASRRLVEGLQESQAKGYGIAVCCFTEDSRGCFCTIRKFTDFSAAKEYLGRIELCRSPEMRVSATGGDGPENLKAALITVNENLPAVPTLCIVITDAPPHLKSHLATSEANHELAWLQQHGISAEVAHDAYATARMFTNHFQENLMVVPVLYGRDPDALRFLIALSQLARGFVLGGLSRHDSGTLGIALCQIALQWMGVDETVALPDSLQIFGVDNNQSIPLNEVEGRHMSATFEPLSESAAKSLYGEKLGEHIALTGRRFGKRAINTKTASVMAQVHFVASVCNRDLESALASLEEIQSVMPEDQVRHIKLDEARVTLIVQNLQEALEKSGQEKIGETSVISMEAVAELVKERNPLEAHSCMLEVPLRMLMVSLLQVRFMTNPVTGEGDDLANAWDAIITKVAPPGSRMTAFEALRLSEASSDTGKTTADPLDRGDYNGAVALVDPSDAVATAVSNAIDSTQLGDIVQGLLVRAPPGLFIPNLRIGVLSAMLLSRCASANISDTERAGAEWQHLRRIAHTIRTYPKSTGDALYKQLSYGRANPEDSVSKFLLVLLRHKEVASANPFRLMCEEMMAEAASSFFGRRTEENDAKYREFIKTSFPLRVPLTDFDPATGVHPLELDDSCADDLISQVCLAEFQESSSLRRCQNVIVAFADLLEGNLDGHNGIDGDDKKELQNSFSRVNDVLTDFHRIVETSVLLRFRKNRYKTVDNAESAEPGERHVPIDIDYNSILRQKLRVAHREELSSLVTIRRETLRSRLIKDLAAEVAGSILSAEGANPSTILQKSSNTSGELQNVQLTLERFDAVDILIKVREVLGDGVDDTGSLPCSRLEEFCRELLLGYSWTTPSPLVLKNRLISVRKLVTSKILEEFKEAISRGDVCRRTIGSNRHGHTAANPFPGPLGWTPRYEKLRLDEGEAYRDRIDKIREFTKFAKDVRRRMAATSRMDGAQRVSVEEVLLRWQDASLLGRVKEEIASLLG